MTVPKALLADIRDLLLAGMDPDRLAGALGRRGMLDFGEITSLRTIALEMHQAMVKEREIPATGSRPTVPDPSSGQLCIDHGLGGA